MIENQDRSITLAPVVGVPLWAVRGALASRADSIRCGVAHPWRLLARRTLAGYWPREVALLLPLELPPH